MTSFLSWIDHDPTARERSQQILALFSEKESRDELGMGTIRDAIADLLFPGTSTIQTRLRYFLFVPWTYEAIERGNRRGDAFLADGRREELRMLSTFQKKEGDRGLIGEEAGASLKRLPSSVYWAGLHSWGIRKAFPGGMEDYSSGWASFKKQVERILDKVGDEEEGDGAESHRIWHRRAIELRPEGFPNNMDFRLRLEEREFLTDRIRTSHPDSLLAWLAVRPEQVRGIDAGYVWEHPNLGQFPSEVREIVELGRVLSGLIQGAAVLYNLQLAELKENEDLKSDYLDWFERWSADVEADLEAVGAWNPIRLWEIVAKGGGRPSLAAKAFLETWHRLVLENPRGLIENTAARELVKHREMALKGGRSRFRNVAARNQWRGGAGTMAMEFRWTQAKRHLDDLVAGL